MSGQTRREEARGERVAVVGTGYWGKNLVRNFHAIDALGAICDSSEETLHRFGEQYPGCRTVTSAG